MRTLTFYSYKGGTGRTLLLSNVAMLAARLGRHVAVLDLDLEAPGLHYKFDGVSSPPGRGAVDWLGSWLRDDPADISDFIVDVPVVDPFRPGGRLSLIPAGRAPSPEYFSALQLLGIDQKVLHENGVDAFLALKDAIEQAVKPDYLFIDSRTGITSTNAVTTRVLADSVIALAVNSPEQLDGTRSVLRTLQPLTSVQSGEPIELHFVLSRLESASDRPMPTTRVGQQVSAELDQEALKDVVTFLNEPAWPIGSTLSVDWHSASVLHQDAGLARREYLAMGLRRPASADLHREYYRIADRLMPQLIGSRELAEIVRLMGTDALAFFDPAIVPLDDSLLGSTIESRSRVAGEADRAITRSYRQRDDLIAAAARAVERYRELAAVNPAASTPGVARSLNNYAIRLSEVGRRAEALALAEEAVTVYRELAEVNPAASTPGVARSLNNYAIRLSEVGRRAEALAPAEEAVTLYRELAAVNPTAYTPDLAMALNNYAIRLSEVGRRAEALTPAEEAVPLFRELAAANPTAYTPNLAMALSNYAIRLSEVGRRAEALAPAEEAVALYRELAAANPATHTPNLAISLNNYAIRLSEVGRRAEALAAAEEAVALCREWAAANPAAYTPDLAVALNTYAIRLAEVGRRAEALAAAEEAVTLLEALADVLPEGFAEQLARATRRRDGLLADSREPPQPS